jgi:hypothetical protein
MALHVTERQTTDTWYELTGDLEACELFPTLLRDSESAKEVENEINSEHDTADGRYDGYPAPEAMEDEVAEFTKAAIAELHDEALAAAKTTLTTALKAGETLLHKNFEDEEEGVLEEAAEVLGVAIPWDPVEAAQVAAEQAVRQAEMQQDHERQALRAKETAEALENARQLFKTGNSHAVVRAKLPKFTTEIASLVGELRKQGVQIARR